MRPPVDHTETDGKWNCFPMHCCRSCQLLLGTALRKTTMMQSRICATCGTEFTTYKYQRRIRCEACLKEERT